MKEFCKEKLKISPTNIIDFEKVTFRISSIELIDHLRITQEFTSFIVINMSTWHLPILVRKLLDFRWPFKRMAVVAILNVFFYL